MKTIAVIPCFNEERLIADIVRRVNGSVDLTIVVDDSSTDDTVEKAQSAGAFVLRRSGKRGYGFNKNAGILEALNMHSDIVITLDGDGQHDPQQTQSLIEPIKRGEADVVIGSRFLSNASNIPKYRRIGIRIITFVYNLWGSQKITDAQCCFRAYNNKVFKDIKLVEGGFTASTEIIIKARAKGFRIKEVPVTVHYSKAITDNSTMNPIKQGIVVAWGTAWLRVKVEVLQRLFK